MSHQLTAVMFPGQGSQEAGMGRYLAETEPAAMELWKMAEKAAGLSLREIFWENETGEMDETRYVQPALTAVNLALWFHYGPGLAPGFLAGHSLGEFSALGASGVLEPREALELTALRGRLMSEADPNSHGGMAAVLKLEQNLVGKLVGRVARAADRVILVANYNTPKQSVVSGEKEALDQLKPLVKEAGGKMVVLPVSGAFHSPMMQDAAKELAGFMKRLHWKSPKVPVMFNSTAEREDDPAKIKRIMSGQMTYPVLFAQLVENLHAHGANQFVELGPKGVLTRMIPQILGKDPLVTSRNISGLQDAAQQE